MHKSLYNLLLIFKEKLFFFKKILIKLYNFIKYISLFLRLNYISKFLKIKNYYIYIFNNVLNNNFLYSLFIKKKLLNYSFNFKKNFFFFNKYYNNLFLKEDDASLNLDVSSSFLIFF